MTGGKNWFLVLIILACYFHHFQPLVMTGTTEKYNPQVLNSIDTSEEYHGQWFQRPQKDPGGPVGLHYSSASLRKLFCSATSVVSVPLHGLNPE